MHEHNHPHVLMLQIASAFFKLPGEYLRPGEDEVQGLMDRLDERLQPVDEEPQSYGPNGEGRGQPQGEWEVGDCLATWWRPGFETFMYPYVPPHITKPKECKKLFLVQMPPNSECDGRLRPMRWYSGGLAYSYCVPSSTSQRSLRCPRI